MKFPVPTIHWQNPFVGLRSYELEEAHLFFGCNDQIIDMLEKLHQTQFLAVVGSSGCGKSSLVRAGLIPKLKAGMLVDDKDKCFIATMKPSIQPLNNLARAIIDSVKPQNPSVKLEDLNERIKSQGVSAIFDSLSAIFETEDANFFLLVDQFEEIFLPNLADMSPNNETDSCGLEETSDFVSLILQMANQKALPIYILITMRSDYLGSCDRFWGLPEAINQSLYLVPRLTRKQLREAVEGPIRLYGQSIEPRLVDRILNETGEEPDQLPIMQHTLMRTWDCWQISSKGPLDFPHYNAIGGIRKAISLHADSALSDITEKTWLLTKKIFQALTDTDSNNRHTKRPILLSNLESITGESRRTILGIISQFQCDGRLFLLCTPDHKTGDQLIELSHESLIRQWPRMNRWVEEEASSANIYRRLQETAELWVEGKAGLWRPPDLELALDWKINEKPSVMWAARYGGNFELVLKFLEASEKKRQEEEKAAEAERLQKQKLQRARMLVTVIGISLILTISLAIWALIEREHAKEAALTADFSIKTTLNAVGEAEEQKAITQRVLADANAQRLIFLKKNFEGIKKTQAMNKHILDYSDLYDWEKWGIKTNLLRITMYDDKENPTEESYYNTLGQRALYTKGEYSRSFSKYNKDGKLIQREYFDQNDKLKLNSSGFARVKYKYDDQGKQIAVGYWGTNGQPVKNKNEGYAMAEMKYDNRGILTEKVLRNPDGSKINNREPQ